MVQLTQTVTFAASHQLPRHDGKCARLHGHSWRAAVVVEGPDLQQSGPKSGMLADYADIGRPLKALVESHLDHWHLNETTGIENPTSEELARWMFWKLRPFIPALAAVVVEETCTSRCEFRPLRDPIFGQVLDMTITRTGGDK